MNRTQTIAVALLVAALPFASTAFAADRGHGDRGNGHQDRDNGHDRHGYRGQHGHDHYRYGYRGHHIKHHYRHRHDNAGHYGHRAQVVLPFPPLPPFPVIVLNKKHHGAHLEQYRRY
jgi:hypothetical protein